MRFRIARALALLVAVVTIASCGGGGDTAAPEDMGPKTGPVTQTITPDGGTLTAYSPEGASFTLVFPQDAVHVPTMVTVTPLPPSGSLYALAALEPAGMLFYEPVDATVKAPDGADLTDAQLILAPEDEPMYLPTSVDTGKRTLSTTLRFFGTRDDSLVVIPGAAAVVGAPGAAGAGGAAGGGNNLGAGAVNCSVIATSTQQAIDALVAQGSLLAFDHALTLALNTAALLQQASCAEWADFATEVGDLACQGLEQAIQDAANSNTSTYGEFFAQSEAIVAWVGTAMQYSTCQPDYLAALDGEIADFILFFNTKLGSLSGQDFATYQDLRMEAQTVVRLITRCQLLGLADAENRIRNNAFNPTLDKMREIAYALCVSDKWHYPLSRLTSTGFFSARDIVGQPSPRPGNLFAGPPPDAYAGFSDEDIYQDMEFCATCLDLQSIATGGDGVDTTLAGGDGAPGQKTSLVAINVPTRGKLLLSGKIPAFTCWDGTGADQEVVVALADVDVLTLRRSVGDDYLAGAPAELDILAAAQAAGITPAEGSMSKLTVRRKVTNCDYRLWAGEPDAEYKLLDATINWKNPTDLDVGVAYADSVDEGDVNTATVTVKVVDQHGVATPTKDIDVTINVVGGAAQTATGKTNAAGQFATAVTATGAALYRAGEGAAPQASMTITANASSFEGLSRQAQVTANVRVCGASAGGFREGGGGTYTKDLSYGHLKAYGTAQAGQYSYATTEFTDGFAVHVNDPALDGQKGFVYIKVHYRFTSTGISESHPAARVVIGPRNGFSSPYFWENNFNTSSDSQDVEEDWEIPITCTFNRSSAKLDVNCDAFARNAETACSVSAEVTWKGVTKITTQDGTPVTNYWLCSASGTDWTLPQ